ncbi:CH domain containing protein [Pyrenophora tritici-repentis]|nr:CH domain containing protein [Pyrenophora tritici-repentis]
MSLDVDNDWDTDEISVTSTVIPDSSDDEEYAIDEIISERDAADWEDKYGPGKRWLVKWEGYGMHDCCWEPLCHFAGGHSHSALALWNKRKESMSREALRKLMERNEREYQEAAYEAYQARMKKQEKRAKKRKKLAAQRAARTRPIVIADSEDEEAMSSRRMTRSGQQRKTQAQVSHQDREAIDSSQLNSLFNDSPDCEAPIRQPPKTRRPPIEQSESSPSEDELTNDSMMDEIGQKSNKSKKKTTRETASTSDRRLTRRAAQASQTPSKAAADSNRKSTSKKKLTRAVSFKEPEKPSPKGSKQSAKIQAAQPSSAAKRRGSNTGEHLAATADETTQPTTSSGTRSGDATQSTTSTTQSTPNTTSGTAAITGLKFVNQPKARSEWKKGDKPFQTLHYRRVADKRSRAEGTPDINALEFVNAPSATAKTKPRVSDNDVYGRREIVHRPEAPESDHDDAPTEQTFAQNEPLAPWEHDKIQMSEYSDRILVNTPDVPVDVLRTTETSRHLTDEQESQLSFPLPPPPPPPFEAPPPKLACASFEARIGSALKLNFKDMFARSDGANPFVDRRAFLFYHPEQHAEELALITRWLMMYHVQIGSATHEGAWEHFRQQIEQGGSGIIIVIGGFIYITEEVFEKKPQLALKIIQLFCAKVTRLRNQKSITDEADDSDLLWRLCVRPELMEYLLKHCEDHEKELEAGDDALQSRAKLYTLLAETEYIDQDDPTTPLSLIPDNFPILSERRDIADTQPVDYFGALARSPQAANLNMIRYYAGLQIDLRRDFRHFFVVHTEPSAPYVHRWIEEIQTIAAVITPEQCVQEFEKDERDSMFDFCERFLREV